MINKRMTIFPPLLETSSDITKEEAQLRLPINVTNQDTFKNYNAYNDYNDYNNSRGHHSGESNKNNSISDYPLTNISFTNTKSFKTIDKRFKCPKCSSSFTRKTRLTEHNNRVHMGKIFQFQCSECDTRLSSKENLNRHSIVHTDRFKCNKCNKRFDRICRFQKHLDKCH